MRALSRALLIAVGVMAADSRIVGDVEAQEDSSQEVTRSRRWGVGWDGAIGFDAYPFYQGGIAVRRRLGPRWEAGLIISPSFGRGDDDDRRSSTTTQVNGVGTRRNTVDTERETDTFAIRALLFRDIWIGKIFALGPYVGAGYGHARYETQYHVLEDDIDPLSVYFSERQERSTTKTDIWWLTLGFRPTFTFDDRFVLESRFGISMDRRSENEDDTIVSRRRDEYGGLIDERTTIETSRREDDSWGFSVFGEELGPGAVVAFTMYL